MKKIIYTNSILIVYESYTNGIRTGYERDTALTSKY